jgi:hypothetical protein
MRAKRVSRRARGRAWGAGEAARSPEAAARPPRPPMAAARQPVAAARLLEEAARRAAVGGAGAGAGAVPAPPPAPSAAVAAHQPVDLGRGRERAYHVCSDGRPGVVERAACEALVHLGGLRAEVLGLARRRTQAVAYSMDAKGYIRDREVAAGAGGEGGEGSGGGGGGRGAGEGPWPQGLAWPPGLWSGRAGRHALELVARRCGVAFGDPYFLIDSFPALLRTDRCFRPQRILPPGALLVKDSGLGFTAEAGEAGRVWRACFSENALWSQLYTALLGEALLGGGGECEWPWKHPWQTAPLDCSEDMSGWMCSARRAAVARRIDAIASAPYPPCALARECQAAAQAAWGRAFLRNRYDLFEPHVLGEIVHAAGGALLARILRRLSADLSSHASGFPDIVLWRAAPGAGAGCGCAFGPQVRDLQALLAAEGGLGGGGGGAPQPPEASLQQQQQHHHHQHGEEEEEQQELFSAARPACALVEVKSQNDRVHQSQLMWFQELQGSSSVVVLKVAREPRR